MIRYTIKKIIGSILLILCFGIILTGQAYAKLEPVITETGKITLSVDAIGTNAPSGIVQAEKPSSDATVRKAFLSCASYGRRIIRNGDVKIDDMPINWDLTAFGNVGNTGAANNFFHNTFSEITSVVKSKIDDAAPGRIDFSISEVSTGTIDGCILSVIFDDPAQIVDHTAILLFGSLSTLGDSFTINLLDPIDKSDPSLALDLSLGISFGYQGTAQYSTIDVNGIRLTSSAGGQDDGASQNGALITVGGLDDSNNNPSPFDRPKGYPWSDDELYSLIPFVADGDRAITFNTLNPSNDDNIFFTYVFALGQAYITPQFNAVRLMDTISTANIDLDQSSFSRQPVSITQDTQNNLTIIEWQYSSFTIGQIEKLNFDIILKNPIPGEDRLVNHKLELIYQDAAGNTIRKELGQQYVHVLSSNFNITPTTDKLEYNANENGIINLSITNIGDMARTVDIHVNMVDSLGNIASQITVIPNTIFNAGQILAFPSITFNTGNTFSGPYQIQATLYEQTKPAGRGKTDITIKSPIPQLGITSAITTDKTAYNANEPVKITSIVTSTAQNYIYTNLTAKIKITNPNNQMINEYQRSILTLMPNSRNEGSIYFNTGSNPAGVYNITQEIYEGTQIISQSATNFTILSTSQTGIGIAGAILPNPKTIIRWQPITLNYNITNIGNSGITDLNLKILIIDPETGNAQTTLTDTISSLGINSTTTRQKTISNLDLPVTKKPKDYLIILQGVLPAGAVTIASSYITIMPALDITKEIKGNARVLIWLCKQNNDHHQSHEADNGCKGETDPLEPIIKEALKQIGIYYYLIVYDKKDFETQLRSNEFNTYLIFNNHEPIENHIDEELTEHINAGKGIAAFFIKKEEQHNMENSDEKGLPIFGVRYKGYLSDEQRTLYLADTEITDADTIITSGKVEKTELLPNSSAQILAYFNDGTPAIITNTYGNGRAVLYTFDLRKTTETATQNQLTSLLKKAIKYTVPSKEPIISGGIIPITIKIQNKSIPITLKIQEQLPANAAIITDSNAIRTGDTLSWSININTNETKELTYYLIAPDTANIVLNTNIYYLTINNAYELYDAIELKIDIKATITQITTPIIEKLNSLILTDKKAEEERQDIIRVLTELQNQTIPQDKKDANKIWEEAIKKTLKAIDELKDIKEELTKANLLDPNSEKTLTEIRLGLDELLMFTEIKWYGTR